MSSLQRAIANNDGGAFENSFAQGLDISELISPTTTSRTTATGEAHKHENDQILSPHRRASAAEELLKIREGERRQRKIQEEEEAKMEEALKKRLNSLKSSSSSSKNNAPRSSFEIGDALLRMHGTDERAAAMLSQKSTNNRKGAAASRRKSAQQQRSSANNNKNAYSKPSLLKKSRRSKF